MRTSSSSGHDGILAYAYPYDSPSDACRIIYRRFMRNPTLTMPECSLYSTTRILGTLYWNRLPSEREFLRKLLAPEVDTVICTAATDAADTRRVVLLLKRNVPEFRELVITFPQAKRSLSNAELALLDFLRQPL